MTVDASERKYERPPLVEAVFELFAEPSGDHFEAAGFFSQFSEYSSEPEPWSNAVVGVELREGRLVSSSLKDQSRGERRWNKDRTRGVLVGPGVLACNILPPYGHFAEHRPLLTRLLAAYVATAKPSALGWIGHRYINRIRARGTPSELLAIYPKLPESLAANHPPFSIQVEAAKFPHGVVVASLGLAEHADGEATYVLDIYARSSVPLNSWGIEEMISWHDRAHLAVRDAFEMAITDAARTLFKEQK